jgi:hypothetical protein
VCVSDPHLNHACGLTRPTCVLCALGSDDQGAAEVALQLTGGQAMGCGGGAGSNHPAVPPAAGASVWVPLCCALPLCFMTHLLQRGVLRGLHLPQSARLRPTRFHGPVAHHQRRCGVPAQAQLQAAAAEGASLTGQAESAARQALQGWLRRRHRRLQVSRTWLAWRSAAGGEVSGNSTAYVRDACAHVHHPESGALAGCIDIRLI